MRWKTAGLVFLVMFCFGGIGGYVLHGQGAIRKLGSGGDNCGSWLTDRKEASYAEVIKAAVRTRQAAIYKEWVNGYLTGRQDGEQSLTENQARDLDGRSAWIDNYCEANPLNDLTDAARALYRELLSL